jgi:hypothetical protein
MVAILKHVGTADWDGVVVRFAEGRAAEGLVGIVEVRVAVVQCIARAGATVNVLVEFR